MRKPIGDDLKELDATFEVERATGGFDLLVESRGGATGGKPPRNTDYAAALARHLKRMGELGMVLSDIQIASRPAMKLPEAARRVDPGGFALPLELARVADPEALRLGIGRASAGFGNPKGIGGNPTKRLRLRVEWPDADRLSALEIEDVLARPAIRSAPTADPVELERRVRSAIRRLKAAKALGHRSAPSGQQHVPASSGMTTRYVRDPEVIAWVLYEAAGTCEQCGRSAPFSRDDGEPFLEVHHVRPLGEGGPDTTDNAAACCPNCHRRLHHGADRERLRLDLIARVRRILDYPPAP